MAIAAGRNDIFMKNVYNGKQLAFKVSMNSIYGFCAAYMLPCQAISASVTTIGRNMIHQTKTLVEEMYPGSKVIYGDTDSVMVIFKTETNNILKESFELGIKAAERISDTFKHPIKLEFEKCYYPYLLFSKKRYAGLMYTNPEKPDYIDAKGIQLVRRDNAEFVRDISKKVLHMIMYDRAIIEAMEYVKQQARQLLDGNIPIDKMTVSKSLRKDYKNNNQPHVHVANKIEQRKPGTGPKCGERVPYVIIETKNPKHLQYEKAEDPNYVKEFNLKLDLLYYLQHSLSSPIVSLFELFFDNPSHQLFNDLIIEFKKKKDNQSSITGFFQSSVTKQPSPVVLKKPSPIKKTVNTQRTINLYF
jgi:DNA polymerase delta subunit 1